MFETGSGPTPCKGSSSCFTLYILLLAAHIGLVWLLPYFPTQDGPSHIYNLAILHDLLNGGKVWGEYYTYNITATPNLGFNLITYPLLSFVTPITAEKVFLSLYLVLMGIAAPVLIRTFASPAPYSHTIKLLALPVMFNFTLMMGFYSYTIAVPAFLLAISLAWEIRNRSWVVKFVGYNASGVLVFYLHLIPFIFFLIALSIFAIVEKKITLDSLRSLAKQLICIFPLLALLLHYFSTGSSSSLPADFFYLLSGQRAVTLLTDLLTFSTVYFSPLQLVPGSIYLFILLLLLRAFVKDLVKGKHRLYAEQKAILLLVLTLTAIYLVAPFRLGDGSFFNDRFPWVILLLLLPLLAGASSLEHPAIKLVITTTVILFLCFNIAIFRQQSNEVASFLEGLRADCSKGEGILLYRTSLPPWAKIDVILHAPSYYGIFNKCVDLGNYEATLPYFPIRFRMEMGPLPHEAQFAYGYGEIDFSRYPSIEKVLAWDLKPEGKGRLDALFNKSYYKGKLSIWSRR